MIRLTSQLSEAVFSIVIVIFLRSTLLPKERSHLNILYIQIS